MEVALVSSKELFDPTENPTLCLSPLRVFNKLGDSIEAPNVVIEFEQLAKE